MATHSSILAWEIPWTEEPFGLQSMGLQMSQTQVSMHAMFFLRPLLLFSIHFLGGCKAPPLIVSSG